MSDDNDHQQNSFSDWLQQLAHKHIPNQPEGIAPDVVSMLQNNRVDETSFLLMDKTALVECGIPLGPRLSLLKIIDGETGNKSSSSDQTSTGNGIAAVAANNNNNNNADMSQMFFQTHHDQYEGGNQQQQQQPSAATFEQHHETIRRQRSNERSASLPRRQNDANRAGAGSAAAAERPTYWCPYHECDCHHKPEECLIRNLPENEMKIEASKFRARFVDKKKKRIDRDRRGGGGGGGDLDRVRGGRPGRDTGRRDDARRYEDRRRSPSSYDDDRRRSYSRDSSRRSRRSRSYSSYDSGASSYDSRPRRSYSDERRGGRPASFRGGGGGGRRGGGTRFDDDGKEKFWCPYHECNTHHRPESCSIRHLPEAAMKREARIFREKFLYRGVGGRERERRRDPPRGGRRPIGGPRGGGGGFGGRGGDDPRYDERRYDGDGERGAGRSRSPRNSNNNAAHRYYRDDPKQGDDREDMARRSSFNDI